MKQKTRSWSSRCIRVEALTHAPSPCRNYIALLEKTTPSLHRVFSKIYPSAEPPPWVVSWSNLVPVTGLANQTSRSNKPAQVCSQLRARPMRSGPSVIPDHLLAGTTELLSPTSSVMCQLVHFTASTRRELEHRIQFLASSQCSMRAVFLTSLTSCCVKPANTLRAAQTLRDFLLPINTGLIAAGTLELPYDGGKLVVENGQRRLDDLELLRWVRQPWWQKFWNRLQSFVRDCAGLPQKDKVVISPPVLTSVVSET